MEAAQRQRVTPHQPHVGVDGSALEVPLDLRRQPLTVPLHGPERRFIGASLGQVLPGDFGRLLPAKSSKKLQQSRTACFIIQRGDGFSGGAAEKQIYKSRDELPSSWELNGRPWEGLGFFIWFGCWHLGAVRCLEFERLRGGVSWRPHRQGCI